MLERQVKWQDREHFDEDWKNRIALMASLFGKEKSVLDLGCGMQWLKDFCPSGMQYYPVDYTNRSDDTIICDFNRYEFPHIHADIAFISGVMEYIVDYRWFVESIAKCCTTAIVSYCSVDGGDSIYRESETLEARRSIGWAHDLERRQIIQLFEENSMRLSPPLYEYKRNDIFRFIGAG